MSDFKQDDVLQMYLWHKELARDGVADPPSLEAYTKADNFKNFLLHPLLEPIHDLVRTGHVSLVYDGGVQISWTFQFGDANRYLEVEFLSNGKVLHLHCDATGKCYGNRCAYGTGYKALGYLWRLFEDVQDLERRTAHDCRAE